MIYNIKNIMSNIDVLVNNVAQMTNNRVQSRFFDDLHTQYDPKKTQRFWHFGKIISLLQI